MDPREPVDRRTVTAVVDPAAMMGPGAMGAEEPSYNTGRAPYDPWRAGATWPRHSGSSAGTNRAVALILLSAICVEDSQVSQSTRSASAPMSAQACPRRCGSRWLRRERHELPRGNSSVVALDGSGGNATSCRAATRVRNALSSAE